VWRCEELKEDAVKHFSRCQRPRDMTNRGTADACANATSRFAETRGSWFGDGIDISEAQNPCACIHFSCGHSAALAIWGRTAETSLQDFDYSFVSYVSRSHIEPLCNITFIRLSSGISRWDLTS